MVQLSFDLYGECGLPRGIAKNGTLIGYLPDYCSENRPKIRPAILIIPGGGYGMLSEREGDPIARRFLANGYAAFVLSYDVQTPHPTPLLQAALAMKLLRKKADDLGIAADKIAAIGFSAGGHLLGSLCYRSDDSKVSAQLGGADVIPNAAIFSYPVITMERGLTHDGTRDIITGGDERLAEYLSLEKAVTKDAPPVFIWHTSDDGLVPVESSLRIADAYRKNGLPFEMHIFPHGRHGLSLADAEVSDSFDEEGIRPDVAIWFPLALTFLKNLGFEVLSKK